MLFVSLTVCATNETSATRSPFARETRRGRTLDTVPDQVSISHAFCLVSLRCSSES